MLILYGTEHCHLCEQAASMLEGLGLDYTKVEIVDDDHLLARYGTLIPVVRDEQGQELCWPFSEHDIRLLTKPG